MGKIVGRNAVLKIEDPEAVTGAPACNISAYANKITLTWDADAPTVTNFGSDNVERASSPMFDWNLAFDGFWSSVDNTSGDIDGLFSRVLGESTQVFFAPSGSVIGCPLYLACAICTSYEMSPTPDAAFGITATFVARSGSLTRTMCAIGYT